MAGGVGRDRAAAVRVRRSDLGCVGRHHAVRRDRFAPVRDAVDHHRHHRHLQEQQGSEPGPRDSEDRQRRTGDDRPGDRRLAQGRRLPLVRQTRDRHLSRDHLGPSLKEPRERQPGGRHGHDRAAPRRDPEADPQADPQADRRSPPRSRPRGRLHVRRQTDEDAEAGRRADPRIAGRTRPATDARTDPDARTFPTATATAPPIIVALGGIGGIGGTGGPGDPGGPGTPGSNGRSGPTGGPSQPSGRGWGPLAGLMAMAGLQGPTFTGLTVGPTLVTTTGAVALGMAFGLFGRRRREDESDDTLSAAAASGVGFMANTAVAVGTVEWHRGRLRRRARCRRHRNADAALATPVAHPGTQGRPDPRHRAGCRA